MMVSISVEEWFIDWNKWIYNKKKTILKKQICNYQSEIKHSIRNFSIWADWSLVNWRKWWLFWSLIFIHYYHSMDLLEVVATWWNRLLFWFANLYFSKKMARINRRWCTTDKTGRFVTWNIWNFIFYAGNVYFCGELLQRKRKEDLSNYILSVLT
jgi:hypothetical protein